MEAVIVFGSGACCVVAIVGYIVGGDRLVFEFLFEGFFGYVFRFMAGSVGWVVITAGDDIWIYFMIYFED